MIGLERRRKISGIVNRGAFVEVEALARQFKVAAETIRRDLRRLADEGRLERSHGGAAPLKEKEAPAGIYFATGMKVSAEGAFIAREAASRVKEADTIMLDDSQACQLAARFLADMKVTVVTPSLRVAAELAGKERVRVIVTGGLLAASRLSLQGPLAERSVESYHVDKLLFSCDGFNLKAGASEADETRAQLKRRMVENSSRRILLMEREKVGVQSLSMVCPARDIHELITDSSGPGQALEAIRKAGILVNAFAKES